jgi:hypothetical protein
MPLTPPTNGQLSVLGQVPVDQAGVSPAVATLADAMAAASLAGFPGILFAPVFNGATFDRPRTAKVFKAVAAGAATAEATFWTPASGKKFRLLRLVLTVSAQSILTFKDNTGGTTILVLELAANTPLSVDLGALGILSATADNVLTITRGTSATLNGFLAGTEE